MNVKMRKEFKFIIREENTVFTATPIEGGYIVSWDDPEIGKGEQRYSEYSVVSAINLGAWNVIKEGEE